LIAFLVVPLLAVVLLPLRSAPGDASSLSRAASGWLTARRYMEERGSESVLLDDIEAEPLETQSDGRTLVLAFPWRVPARETVLSRIDEHLEDGGKLVIAFTVAPVAVSQSRVLEHLNLDWRDAHPRPSLHPLRFFEAAAAEWRLVAVGASGQRDAVLRAPIRLIRAPPDARVHYEGPDQTPVVFSFPQAGGEVLVLPAETLSNARLTHAGNVDLLETVRLWGGDAWAFDEYHHGLVPPMSPQGRQGRGAVDAFIVHLILLYGFVVWAFAKRFGPAWREPYTILGSTDSFLRGLGTLHDRLGHHARAARLLVSRAQELTPTLSIPQVPEGVRIDRSGLLRVARDVARAQAHSRRRA
jgi:hypothetical protein